MARQLRLSLLAALFAVALCHCLVFSAQSAAAKPSEPADEDVPAVDDGSLAAFVDAVSQGEDEEALEAMYAREAERQREQEKVITQKVEEIQKNNKKKKLGKILGAAVGSVAAVIAALATSYVIKRRRASGYEKV